MTGRIFATRRWLRGRGVAQAAAETAPGTLSPLLLGRLSAPPDPLAELLLDHLGGSVLVVDRTGLLVRSTARLRQMIGNAAPLTPGTSALRIFVSTEREALWERLRGALIGQVPQTAMIARLDQGNAEALTVELHPLVLREADGTASGLILRLVDISAQLRLEAQLAQSQKLQAVGELSAGIAHDFNNLLTAIVGAADMIEARPCTDPTMAADAALIRGSAERGAALVRQLLAFGRQQALQPGAISINDAIHNLSGLLTRLLGSRVVLVIELENPGRMACVDPTQLDQVVINLAVNARDAMPEGGTLTLRSGHITLYRPLVRGPETIPPGRYVMIEVQDTGTGIDPELLPRIFDPFVTTKRERGGTGLGLSTVHGIVRQSDGFLGVESEPGQGTRMRVYLPRLDDATAAIPALPPPPPSPAFPPCTPQQMSQTKVAPIVLLVDDETMVRRLAERALRQAGWTVLAADSGEAALALMEGSTPPPLGLLISDVMMPGIDGPALAARLRRRSPDLPVLLISGYADEKLRAGLEGKNLLFLPKPYRLPELIAAAKALR